MRKLDQFDRTANTLFNMVRDENPDDAVEDSIGDALRAAYTAGLRRAQELAKEHVYATEDEVFEPGRGHVRVLDWEDYDQAIDAEAAKERT